MDQRRHRAQALDDSISIERFNRAILRLALWTLPLVLFLEWIPEVLEGEPEKLPRWYIYGALWLLALLLLRKERTGSALWVILPSVGYLAVNTVREAIEDRNLGAPEPATTLAILVGLSLVIVLLARAWFWPLLFALTGAVGIVAVVTGVDEGLGGDDLVIRVIAPMLVTALSAWIIRRLQDELANAALSTRAADEARDQLVAALSHELRTPLTGVVGLSEELANSLDSFSAEETAELTHLIESQAKEMSHIIEDLLVAARTDAGSITMRPASIALRATAEEVIDRLRSSLEDLEHTILVTGDEAWAYADPLRTRQIIRNLVSNAVRHGGRSIVVGVESEARLVTLSVVDDGHGLAVEDVERVFDPYVSGEAAPVPGSVGLGLAVARGLARLMDGELTCVITEETTSFELSLPRSATVGAAAVSSRREG